MEKEMKEKQRDRKITDQMGADSYPPVYRQPNSYAVKHGEEYAYAKSRWLNIECRDAISKVVNRVGSNEQLSDDAVESVLKEYGVDRIAFILSSTIQQELWSAGYTEDNKAWALESPIPKNMIHGIDMRREWIVYGDHEILNSFVSLFRKAAMEQGKQRAAFQGFAKEEHENPEHEKLASKKRETAQNVNSMSARRGMGDIVAGDETRLGDGRGQLREKTKKPAKNKRAISGDNAQKPGTLSGVRGKKKPDEKEPEVTWVVSECSEYHGYGKLYEHIHTVEEAIATWKRIPPGRRNAIPAIGINIHRPGDEPYQDAKMDILIGDRIDLMMLDCYSEIKNNTQAMEAIAELVAKLPGIEIEGELPKHEAFAKFKEKNSCTNGEKGLDKPSLKGELKKKSQCRTAN